MNSCIAYIYITSLNVTYILTLHYWFTRFEKRISG